MRILGMAGWLLLATACGAGGPVTATSGPSDPSALVRSDVSIDDFAAAQAKGAVIVDVRTDDEWSQGHVPGAIHVPVDQVDPGNNTIKTLNKDAPIYFICAAGGRSARAADRMAAAGYHALNVLGGTNAWVEKGLPLEKPGDAAAPAAPADPAAAPAAPADPAAAPAAPTPTP